ncbi:MAG: endonuclease/exonuclease/phosphatase family protein [Candidatus Saccharimonadales bacterium]
MTLSVLQWNVWIFEKKENLLKLIKDLSPDVVCMQELTIGSSFQDGVNVVEYLAKELGYNQFHKAIPNLAPSEGVGDLANGIMTKLPIVSTDWKWIQQPQYGGSAYDDQYRLYVEATVSAGSKKLTFGTAHVSYTDRFIDTPQRRLEADSLLEIAASKNSNYMLTGDFNSLPDSYLVSSMQKKLIHAGPDFDVKTWTTKPFSYNGFEETKLNWRLDYAFATKNIQVLSAEAIHTEYSDHLPILIKLNLG